jgi:hypothetical protein
MPSSLKPRKLHLKYEELTPLFYLFEEPLSNYICTLKWVNILIYLDDHVTNLLTFPLHFVIITRFLSDISFLGRQEAKASSDINTVQVGALV